MRKKFMTALAFSSAVAAACLASAATVFSDTFAAGSVLNPASYPTPTATSTGYTIASTKGASSSLASGDLRFGMGATTSGFVETQARFAATPVALASAGDTVQFSATFTNTTNIAAGGTSAGLYFGLYNSGGNNPATGLQSSGLTTTAGSGFATGNAANFQGYNARILASGGSNQLFTRPVQNGAGTTSANQELLGNGAGGGLYNNPTGANLGQATSAVTLAAGAVYTADLIITLNADGTQTITASLYGGAAATGTSLATQIDFSAITVNATLATVPEPAAIAALGLGAVGFVRRRRA